MALDTPGLGLPAQIVDPALVMAPDQAVIVNEHDLAPFGQSSSDSSSSTSSSRERPV
jgi:hypothetical protein